VAGAVSGRAALGLACLLAAGPCGAASWQADGQSGELRFTAVQAGAKFTGRFTRFRVALDLDPAAPAQGLLEVTVDTGSADTADGERDAVLASQDFFWTEKHPQAVYRAKGFRVDGKGYIAEGDLTLRGVTRPVAVRFTVKPGARRTVMKGGARIGRLEFGVGQGDWADTTWVADAVEIAFELRLRPATAAASP